VGWSILSGLIARRFAGGQEVEERPEDEEEDDDEDEEDEEKEGKAEEGEDGISFDGLDCLIKE
jgi:hypothetical protein